jgi:hypothetical protein
MSDTYLFVCRVKLWPSHLVGFLLAGTFSAYVEHKRTLEPWSNVFCQERYRSVLVHSMCLTMVTTWAASPVECIGYFALVAIGVFCGSLFAFLIITLLLWDPKYPLKEEIREDIARSEAEFRKEKSNPKLFKALRDHMRCPESAEKGCEHQGFINKLNESEAVHERVSRERKELLGRLKL